MRHGEYPRLGWVLRRIMPSATTAAPVAPVTVVAPPGSPCGLLVFVYGPGACRPGPRDRPTVDRLARAGYISVLADLSAGHLPAGHLPAGAADTAGASGPADADVADVGCLAGHLTAIVDRVAAGNAHPVGLFAAGPAAAAALVVAADRPERVRAVVSRGGSPDLAGATLADVTAPTLLVLGSQDGPLIPGNKRALAVLGARSRLVVLPSARHLFSEPDAMRDVAEYARDWFDRHLKPAGAPAGTGGAVPMD